MQHVDEAFVLRTQPLGEADLIVTLLARTHGNVRGVARSARRSRRRFGGLLEPLTRVEATWSVKAGRELHRIEGLEARRSYAAMQADPLMQAVCAVLAEVGETFSIEGAADDREFRLVAAVLDSLEQGADPLLMLRYFEFWTLRLHGLLGDPGECAGCGAAIENGRAAELGVDGGFHCSRCTTESGIRLATQETRWIGILQRSKPDALPDARAAACSGGPLERLLRGQLERFSERRFRSYRHVHLFAERGDGGA